MLAAPTQGLGIPPAHLIGGCEWVRVVSLVPTGGGLPVVPVGGYSHIPHSALVSVVLACSFSPEPEPVFMLQLRITPLGV